MFKALIRVLSLVLSVAFMAPTVAAPTSSSAENRKIEAPATSASSSENGPSAAVVADNTQQVNINNATAQELAAALNGVGLKKAEAIVSYREKYGPFTQVEQLKEVPGIGPALYGRNVSRITL